MRAVTVLIALLLLETTAEAANLIQAENTKVGTTDWQLSHPATNHEIEGYASLTSVQRGSAIKFFVNTQEKSYRIDIFRLGWYGGTGGRLVQGGIQLRGIRQPIPIPDPVTGLIECQWKNPYVLVTSSRLNFEDWVSGVYLAKLTARTSGAQSYIIFVVRDEARQAEYLFQSSVTTFQAYNNWGGKSLYPSNSKGKPAQKVSFNRPYNANGIPAAAYGIGAGDFFTTNSAGPDYPISPAGWEYNMVRWLEREGYDVTYSTNLDVHTHKGLLTSHKAFLSVGHDEYWSWQMRANVEQARDQGVSLGFFSANSCYWQIRLEPSLISGESDRTMVAYKETALREDPYALDHDPSNEHLITTRWRDSPLNRPEDALIGVMFESVPVDADIVITNQHRILSGSGLREGDRLVGLLGYEVDRMFGHAPATIEVIAHSPYQHHGQTRYADMTIYQTPNGSTVFATGSLQWTWGLDDFNAPVLRPSRLSTAAQQITRNVLALLAGKPPTLIQ